MPLGLLPAVLIGLPLLYILNLAVVYRLLLRRLRNGRIPRRFAGDRAAYLGSLRRSQSWAIGLSIGLALLLIWLSLEAFAAVFVAAETASPTIGQLLVLSWGLPLEMAAGLLANAWVAALIRRKAVGAVVAPAAAKAA